MLPSEDRPVSCALRDQPTFELRNGSKDMEHQLVCRRDSIDPLIQADHPVCGFRLTLALTMQRYRIRRRIFDTLLKRCI